MSKGNIEINTNDVKAILNDLKAAEEAYKSTDMIPQQMNVHDRITALSNAIEKSEVDRQEAEKTATENAAITQQVDSIFGIK